MASDLEGEIEGGTLLALSKVQETSQKIEKVSENKFSTRIRSEEAGVNQLLYPIAQLHTVPEPEVVMKRLKLCLHRKLKNEGIEASQKRVEDFLNPIIKDFLEDIFEIAEKNETEPPECYKKLYENL